MRFSLYLLFWSVLSAQALTFLPGNVLAGPAQTWSELRTRREALKSFHEEFEISRIVRVGQNSHASKSSVVIDGAAERWRERAVSGAGDHVIVFDGQESFEFEDGGDEYVRLKRSPKREDLPQPGLYRAAPLDLLKAIERGRESCGLINVDHECVTIDIPIKPWIRNGGTGNYTKMLNGTRRVVFDTVTGLLVSSRTVENIENSRGGYQSDTIYLSKEMSYNGDGDEALFRLPPGAIKEVKELSPWNADRLKKQLGGKTAPDFIWTDIQGKAIRLSDLKGRTVLLDFWATWCGPCRADAPALDKLYEKYGAKNLTIIGISVNEERAVVQKFLSEHPHQYAIALTTENEMPRPYQIGVFPTYIVIDPEGNLASASQGDKGFSELRKLLKKAGLETD